MGTDAVGDVTSYILLATNLTAARSQMAFTLGTHIVLACLGVGFPAIMLVANYLGIRRGDADALLLARRWSKVIAVTFAVGAVTGTVLSFELGMLWPGLFDRFGAVFGLPFAIEGIFFFTEAVFISLYIYGWERLSPWALMALALLIFGGCVVLVAGSFQRQYRQGGTPAPQGEAPAREGEAPAEPR